MMRNVVRTGLLKQPTRQQSWMIANTLFNRSCFNQQVVGGNNFSMSRLSVQQQSEQNNSGGSSSGGGKQSSPFKKLFKTSLLLSLGISAMAIIWSVRQYNQEPNDSVLDRLMKNLYGPYRNYVQLTSEQPNIEETLVYNNEMMSFDASNSADTTDVLSSLFVKPGLLIKEEIHNVGGSVEVFDDYGHSLDLIWMFMSRDEFNKASNHVDSGSREELLSGDDFDMLEASIRRGLNPEEEIVWMERINSKNMVSSKEFLSLPESVKNKPNCVIAVIKTPDAYAHKKDYFETRYGADAAKKISSPANRDLYRAMVLAPYFNYFLAIGRSYPNQMINFDLARKDLSREELEKVMSFIPESQKPTFNAIARKSTSKSYEVIRDLRETVLRMYADRLTLKGPPEEDK